MADPPDVVILHDGREGAMDDLAQAGRREGRKPVVDVPALASTAMGKLHGASRAVLVNCRRHPPVLRHDGVRRAVDLAVIAGVLGRHGGGAAKLREADPAFRLFRLVADVALADYAAKGISRRVARAEETIPDAQFFDLERLEKAGVPAHPGSPSCRGMVLIDDFS
jgi:hypothetical protein